MPSSPVITISASVVFETPFEEEKTIKAEEEERATGAKEGVELGLVGGNTVKNVSDREYVESYLAREL
jgi:hypothetical protein